MADIAKRNAWDAGEKAKGPIERIRQFLLQDINRKPIALNEKEKKQLYLMQKAFAYLCNGFERRNVVKLLLANDGMEERNAYSLINSTIKLFGDINKSSLAGLKVIERENYLRIAREAEDAAKLENDGNAKAKLLLVATRARELASKIAGTFEPEKQTQQAPILPVIMITSDKSAMPQPQRIPIDDDDDESEANL